jgi:hypothetical protein
MQKHRPIPYQYPRPSPKALSAKGEHSEPPSTRWWEAYAVRYFIGFVVGTICIAILIESLGLASHLRELSSSGSKEDGSTPYLLLAVLGLGYCYAASTPIAVLHFGRYDHGWLDGHARHFWFGWLLSIVYFAINGTDFLGADLSFHTAGILIGGIGTIILPVSPSHKRGLNFALGKCGSLFQELPKILLLCQSLLWALIVTGLAGFLIGKSVPNASSWTKILWLLSAPVIWIGVSQYFVLFRLFSEQEDINKFYRALFRARRQENAKDVRDTYSHLREHSNSIFIVVVELSILAGLLALHASSSSRPISNLPNTGFYQWLLVATVTWMLPTVFLWGRANAFEKSFAENPEYFLDRRP